MRSTRRLSNFCGARVKLNRLWASRDTWLEGEGRDFFRTTPRRNFLSSDFVSTIVRRRQDARSMLG